MQELKESPFAKKYVQEIDAILSEVSNVTKENIQRLQEKIKTPSMIISLEKVDLVEAKVNTIIEKVNLIIQDYNKKIDDKEKSMREIKEKFWEIQS